METTEFIKQLKELKTEGKTTQELYNEISSLAMVFGLREEQRSVVKNAYYLSMEFLIGRSFFNNLMELGVLDETCLLYTSDAADD